MSIRIVVAVQHLLILEAIVESLEKVANFNIVGKVAEPKYLVPTTLQVRPEVVVVDAEGFAWESLPRAAGTRRVSPRLGVILMATLPSRGLVDKALKGGVLGIVSKQTGLRHLIDAISGAAAGYMIINPTLLWAPPTKCGPLSEREAEILRLTASGASVKEIAHDMHLAAGTVRNLTSAAIKKLNARNRFDAARIASERCLI
ncbi:response regulator containing a CheY-like receiver [Frankia casuarinae]|jgi:two-component system response regulator DesR|uniref:Two component transcriptional regulator, LuxR family n=1 Tax=Frankia casuarinae (strain DSM 45818 / CECT 9043 / HFP020203 / CcI3) TaxID=106370 RepID=Q2J586_FRACC|nr:response regulator transcription factor [Frankia casuarinae]ABD13556.1 two component transcriptional regulator, LuxR family [Frankia casuarinae]EYT90637.1 response regulator containing a CheY-like receiver [Frankia casuarinae]